MKTILTLIIPAALFAQTATNPVYNRSFEIYNPQNGTIADGWAIYGQQYWRSCAVPNPWDGQCVAQLNIPNAGAEAVVTFNQAVAKPIRISARLRTQYVNSTDNIGGSLSCKVEFADGTSSWCYHTPKTRNVGNNPNWILVGYNTWNLSNAVKPVARIRLRLLQGPQTQGNIYFDDVHAEVFEPRSGMVSIMFDDSFLSHYTKFFPIMKQYGFCGTLATVTSYVGTANHMTLAQIREMVASCYDVASHSHTHADLTKIPLANLNDELWLSHKTLVDWGLPTYHLVTPYGAYDQRVMSRVQAQWYNGYNFRSVRNTDIGYNPQGVFPYNVYSFSVKDTTTLAEINAMLQKAREQKSWLILVFHEIDNPANAPYNLTSDNFRLFMSAVANSGLPVKTYGEAFNLMTAK